jgi:thiamine-phosphate pyrophosphorylase
MHKRQARSLPKTWLMTDERLGDTLLPSVAALPRGSGIIFRHYSLDLANRRALLVKLSAVARRRGHVVVITDPALGLPRWRFAGFHGRGLVPRWALHTAPIHSLRQAIAAQRGGADLLFVSPIFATQSHPDAPVLGRVRFGLLIRSLQTPIIALGGMNPSRARSLRPMKIYGWAAISAFTARS